MLDLQVIKLAKSRDVILCKVSAEEIKQEWKTIYQAWKQSWEETNWEEV